MDGGGVDGRGCEAVGADTGPTAGEMLDEVVYGVGREEDGEVVVVGAEAVVVAGAREGAEAGVVAASPAVVVMPMAGAGPGPAPAGLVAGLP